MGRPLFISFEGVDGAGKTTQIERLSGALKERGRRVKVFREPGGTDLGERVRVLLLEGDDVVPWAEVSLFAAARAQLVERELRPSLAAGYDLICDRYVDSSVAYQGLARGLGADAVLSWNMRVTGGLLPDVTFLLELSAERASARVSAGAAGSRGSPDRLERESPAFRDAVARSYGELAAREPQRIVALDATLAADALAGQIVARVERLLADTAAAET